MIQDERVILTPLKKPPRSIDLLPKFTEIKPKHKKKVQTSEPKITVSVATPVTSKNRIETPKRSCETPIDRIDEEGIVFFH